MNVASFGFSSAVASRANASSKRFGGKAAFLGATVRSLLSYDNTDVWLSLDDGPRERRRVLMTAVGNGRFFGGGMKICPARAARQRRARRRRRGRLLAHGGAHEGAAASSTAATSSSRP